MHLYLKKKNRLARVLVFATSMLLVSLVDARTLKVQTSFSASHKSLAYLKNAWVGKLKEMTQGSLEIELLPIKSVVPHRETPQAVALAILDGDLTAPSYFAGKDPAFALLGDLVGGYENPAQIHEFCMLGGGRELLQKLYDKYNPGVHVIGCSSEKREALVSKKPVRTVDDLKGLKIRSPEGLIAAVFKMAGAAPVSLPGSEVYSALEKNVIDAADASAYANNDASGMHKVARYPIYPGIHSMPVMQFTLSDSVWSTLSLSEQQALSDWFAAAYNNLREFLHEKDRQLVARDIKEGKITVVDWKQSERDKFRKIAQKTWEKFAVASPLAREVFDAHMDFMKKKGIL